MQYIDKNKSAVKLYLNERWHLIPRDHRLWFQYEIDKAELMGKIAEYTG